MFCTFIILWKWQEKSHGSQVCN